MPLPETIAVHYTEEEAEYLSVRPVVRQTFRAAELVDMIVAVAGKDPRRIHQILRSGTVVYHSFRYWWQGFEPDPAALEEILAAYPDADPDRPFSVERCIEVILESSGSPPRHSARIRRAEAAKKNVLRALLGSRTFWDALMNLAAEPHAAAISARAASKSGKPRYREYSYELRGDLYAIAPLPAQLARLASAANRYAARQLRLELASLPSVSQIVFVCRR